MARVPSNRIAIHPGALLLEQIEEMGLTVNGVARDINLPATRLHEIVHERRGVIDRAGGVLWADSRILDECSENV